MNFSKLLLMHRTWRQILSSCSWSYRDPQLANVALNNRLILLSRASSGPSNLWKSFCCADNYFWILIPMSPTYYKVTSNPKCIRRKQQGKKVQTLQLLNISVFCLFHVLTWRQNNDDFSFFCGFTTGAG